MVTAEALAAFCGDEGTYERYQEVVDPGCVVYVTGFVADNNSFQANPHGRQPARPQYHQRELWWTTR